MSEYFKITKEWLNHFKSGTGFLHHQAQLLGWTGRGRPTVKWMESLEDALISSEVKILFEKLPDLTQTQRTKQYHALANKLRRENDSKYSTLCEKYTNHIPVMEKYNSEFLGSNEFLNTHDWKKLRMQALMKFGNSCQCCGRGVAEGAKICVDHIRPRKLFPELSLSINNLQILCFDCNEGKGNIFVTNWKKETSGHSLWDERSWHKNLDKNSCTSL